MILISQEQHDWESAMHKLFAEKLKKCRSRSEMAEAIAKYRDALVKICDHAGYDFAVLHRNLMELHPR